MPLFDSFGRRIEYLRLSVTNRCNLRCIYCLPKAGFSPLQDILNDEEIVRLAKIFVRLGLNKIRVTGGEPLTRPGIIGLVERLSGIDGINDVSMSTNGLLLSRLAPELKAAGLKRVNISLDSLNPERFRQITRLGELKHVMGGIYAAMAAGLFPVKINVVIIKGINDDEIPDFARLTLELPLQVRFIELMPIGETGFFSKEKWVSLKEIQERCGPLAAVEKVRSPLGHGPAVYYKAPGALGTVGFIGALSCNFCGRCNRLRLSAEGKLRPCLASQESWDIGAAVRSRTDDGEIEGLIRRVVAAKPERHFMEQADVAVRETFMCALGG